MTTTVQNYLDKGLRGLWYPVLASWEVQSAPVGITRLGEQIVVWRNKDGELQALEDRCPHRGARLSMGWNLGDRIAAGITAWKWPGMAKLKMFRRSTNVRWWASSACAATTSRKRMARYSCGLRPPPTSSPSRSPSRKSWPIATNTATSSAPPRGNATISTRWKT